MTLTQRIALNWSGDGSTAINGSIDLSGDGLIVLDIGLVNSSSQVAAQSIRAAGLSGIYMKSDIACTVTFRNAGGGSVGSKTLAANVPYVWLSASGDTSPISDDVVALDISAAATGTLKIRGQQDTTPAVATAALSGSLVSSHLESGIVTGGYTAILTLTGANWVASGATFNAQRQAIIDGFVAATSQTNGWNNEVKPAIAVTDVARTSSTIVTITLPAVGAYDISTNEVVTATIPAPATTADNAIVASPTVTITAGS